MTDLTPHQLGFTHELQDQLWNAERRVKELKAERPATKPDAAALAKGRIRSAEWLAKTIKQALAREAPGGDG